MHILRPQCFKTGTQPQEKGWKEFKHLEVKDQPAQECLDHIYLKDTGNKHSDPKGHMHLNVYSSSVHNSQTRERAQMPIIPR